MISHQPHWPIGFWRWTKNSKLGLIGLRRELNGPDFGRALQYLDGGLLGYIKRVMLKGRTIQWVSIRKAGCVWEESSREFLMETPSTCRDELQDMKDNSEPVKDFKKSKYYANDKSALPDEIKMWEEPRVLRAGKYGNRDRLMTTPKILRRGEIWEDISRRLYTPIC